jgi:hypothetical protein
MRVVKKQLIKIIPQLVVQFEYQLGPKDSEAD